MPTLAKKRKALVNPTKAVEARRKRKVRADKQKEADRPQYPIITRFADEHLEYFFDRLRLVKSRQTYSKNWRIEDLRDIALYIRKEFKLHFTTDSLKGKQTTIKQEQAIWIKHLTYISSYNAPPRSAPSAYAEAEEAYLQNWPEYYYYIDSIEPQQKAQIEELVGDEVATGYEATTTADLIVDTLPKEEEAESSDSNGSSSNFLDLSQLSEQTRGIRLAKRNKNDRKRAKAKAQKAAAEKRIHYKNKDKSSVSAARAAIELLYTTLAEFIKT